MITNQYAIPLNRIWEKVESQQISLGSSVVSMKQSVDASSGFQHFTLTASPGLTFDQFGLINLPLISCTILALLIDKASTSVKFDQFIQNGINSQVGIGKSFLFTSLEYIMKEWGSSYTTVEGNGTVDGEPYHLIAEYSSSDNGPNEENIVITKK
jgi:hypothetical protein